MIHGYRHKIPFYSYKYPFNDINVYSAQYL